MSENKVDIARAMKDKTYFNTLTPAQKETVRASNPVGEGRLSDADLDTVSGGLEGGDKPEATTTSTKSACTCTATTIETTRTVDGCVCVC